MPNDYTLNIVGFLSKIISKAENCENFHKDTGKLNWNASHIHKRINL